MARQMQRKADPRHSWHGWPPAMCALGLCMVGAFATWLALTVDVDVNINVDAQGSVKLKTHGEADVRSEVPAVTVPAPVAKKPMPARPTLAPQRACPGKRLMPVRRSCARRAAPGRR